MKKVILSLVATLVIGYYSFSQELSPYIKVGELTESIQSAYDKVISTLEGDNFTILGTYNPSNKSSLKVVVFTRSDIKNKVVQIADRGALAAAFKVGLVKLDGKVVVSYTNPDYIFRAYLRDNYVTFQSTFEKFSADVKTTFSSIGKEFAPFGGTVKADKLKKYHYKIAMPYFTDPVELNEYASFEEGLKTIEANLKAKKGNSIEVYKLVYPNKKVAVFGVGLQSAEKGEANFLHKIGESHAAALPYEIILQGNEATMLHGRYRIALHWPDLTMGTFMKIMSTPGDIKDALKAVCK
ncbi:hypothetical protein MWU58_00040 [Flavobacteriaceae bacterium S0825]|uniref:hypothetical protein n=1 Tax=Gaetbulibacter sp. S0825 TaxID=2720084 RepID=UPI00142F47AB|nr:hypothetical protein [Gaetbulibacter sp. S0825]MCK0107669.1 hypothetical protein [Flavobacteriaceae bacterium S0825]NIX63305.1 hypothetical protein [Gaetbulibacter sp. S0825]